MNPIEYSIDLLLNLILIVTFLDRETNIYKKEYIILVCLTCFYNIIKVIILEKLNVTKEYSNHYDIGPNH